MDVVYSVNGVPYSSHTREMGAYCQRIKPYMEPYYESVLDTVERPTWILRGYAGASVAVLTLAKQEYLHVVYREVSRTDAIHHYRLHRP